MQSNKNNVSVSETQCVIYRPESQNSKASRKKFKVGL